MTTSLDDLMARRSMEPDDTVVRDLDGAVDEEPFRVTTDEESEDLFDAEALLPPQRTSRLTIVLVALLILVVGFLLGVLVEQSLGSTSSSTSALPMVAAASSPTG